MAKLSVTQAWSETGAFLLREGRLILPIALLLLVIPPIVLELVRPPSNTEPAPLQLMLMFVLSLVGLAMGLVAVIAITHLAIRPGASVGEALQVGGRRFVPLLLASLLIIAAIMAIVVPLLIATGGQATEPASRPGGYGPIPMILMLATLALWVRLMLMAPVATAEPVGPIAIIRRSWALTGEHYWKLLGVCLLLLVVMAIAALAFISIFGLLLLFTTGPLSPGSTGETILSVLGILLQTVATVVFAVWISRVYLQLRGSSATDVFA